MPGHSSTVAFRDGLPRILLSNSGGPTLRSCYSSLSYGTELAHANVFNDMRNPFSGDTEYGIFKSLQARYPDYTLTMAHSSAGLLDFARAGEATATLSTEGQNLLSWLEYKPHEGVSPPGQAGEFHDRVKFGRYDYQWQEKSFLVYLYCQYHNNDPPEPSTFFILHKRDHDHMANGYSSAARALIAASSSHTNEVHVGDVLVYDDDSWTKSTKLWKSVQQSTWENVILNNDLKQCLIKDVEGFFDQKDDYARFGAPWKRGIILHGLPGNGKTITVKALMNGLAARPKPIPTLYVKSGKGDYGVIYAIRKIFKKAREMTPCLLVFEDLDSLITEESRSFFLNEVDGMESNDGIMMIGSTNYLEKLDAGITKRPSRFDRKYHFDLPAFPERTLYCEYWRSRLSTNPSINFPAKMCSAIAGITDGFSFAYLQEAFVSSLLSIVSQQRDGRGEMTDVTEEREPKSLEEVMLWREVCKQVEWLRDEIKGSRKSAKDAVEYIGPKQASKAGFS